jgi:hypothetical protein
MANNIKYIPQIDYTSRDYTSILDDLFTLAKSFNPGWTSTDPADLGVTLLELFAYLGDLFNFYIDRAANEGFLATASQRDSVLQIAGLLGYVPTSAIPATTTLTFYNKSSSSITVPALTQVASTSVVNGNSNQIIFETSLDVVVPAAVNGVNGSATMGATQGVTKTETLGSSNGALSQILKLSSQPVFVQTIKVYVNDVLYTYSPALINNSQYDSVFTTINDADGYTYIVFGDGISGRVPPPSAPISAVYRVSDGAAGNVSADSIQNFISYADSSITVRNINSPGVGGTNAESTDSIKFNAPKAMKVLNRAVSLKDYGYLAVQVPGVSRANAEATISTNVNLYISTFSGSAGTFTTSSATITGVSSGSGTITYSASLGTVQSITSAAITLTTTVQLNYDSAHTVAFGDLITVSGASTIPNGTFSVTAISNTTGAYWIKYVSTGLTNNSSITTGLGTVNLVTYNIGDYVTVTGMVPISYNVNDAVITAATATGFTITSSATGTFVSGGTAVAKTGLQATFNTLTTNTLSYFSGKTAPNTTLNVLPPTHTPIDLEITVNVLPQYSQTSVITQVKSALAAVISPNNSFFADQLPVQYFLTAAASVAGVQYSVVNLLRKTSNQQLFYVTGWARATNVVTLTLAARASGSHNITVGSFLRISGVNGSFDTSGTTGVVVTAVGTNTVSFANTGSDLTGQTPSSNSNYVQVLAVDSISCATNELPTVGTITVNASGGIS